MEKKKTAPKIIYEAESGDEEEEEVIVVKRKPKAKPKEVAETPQPSYQHLTNMSVEQQIRNKFQNEKINCLFNQLTGKF